MCERCPHFRGWYVPDSMKLGPEDVSICEVSWDTTIEASHRISLSGNTTCAKHGVRRKIRVYAVYREGAHIVHINVQCTMYAPTL